MINKPNYKKLQEKYSKKKLLSFGRFYTNSHTLIDVLDDNICQTI